MFENIIDMKETLAITAITVIAWIGITSYSRFVEHKKKNKDIDEDKYLAKFAFIPYLFIPLVFGSVAVIVGLTAGDWAVAKGYITSPYEIATVSATVSVLAECLLDKYLVSHTGDAVYFQTIEDKVVKSAGDAAEQTLNLDTLTAEQKAELIKRILG